MSKLQLAIYDEESDYVYALANYILEKKSNEIDVCVFTNQSGLKAFCEKSAPDVLLVGDCTGHQMNWNDASQLVIFLLNHKGVEQDGEEKICISKYQSADEIIRRIYWYYEEHIQTPSSLLSGGDASRLRWVYSPSKSVYQTPFAIELAAQLGREHRVLYVNLCENPSLEWMLQETFERDLSDLLYLAGRQSHSMEKLLASVVCQVQGIALIPSMKNSIDRQSFLKEEWTSFFQKIKAESGYEYVVVDSDCILPGFPTLLGECEKVYLPHQDTAYEQARMREFFGWLKRQEHGLEPVIEEVTIPTVYLNFSGAEVVNQWGLSELGEIIRDRM